MQRLFKFDLCYRYLKIHSLCFMGYDLRVNVAVSRGVQSNPLKSETVVFPSRQKRASSSCDCSRSNSFWLGNKRIFHLLRKLCSNFLFWNMSNPIWRSWFKICFNIMHVSYINCFWRKNWLKPTACLIKTIRNKCLQLCRQKKNREKIEKK